MPERESRLDAAELTFPPHAGNGVAELSNAEKRHVVGFRFVYGLAPQEPMIELQLRDRDSGFQTFHIPLPDAMYLLGALQHVQQETEAEIPLEPPALAR
ncbi:hypothetical protein GCM10011491_02950 [Brucella endophytica]|uniref:Uncharacterized protein n=1 Tax=Brucella endophytica TaxID=1963359 RepID=A0A916W945_9HYPH|nr:hypothetical protein [Brucella endophytica]GGA79113.1 hypothetical protein GCM10011491_02950 [Brucella endophytica]